MCQVALTIGPQGAGKSTFCESVIQVNPEISLVSRDQILVELFGRTHLDPYTGGHLIAIKKMWERMGECIADGSTLAILDCWNAGGDEAREIINHLRALGVSKVIAWKFITTEDTAFRWFCDRSEASGLWRKPKSEQWRDVLNQIRRDDYSRQHRAFGQMNVDLIGGFDKVVEINPIKPPPFTELFLKEVIVY